MSTQSSRESHLRYADVEPLDVTAPSAILWDGGALIVPIYAVTAMSLSESYHVPPLGSSAAKAASTSSDDTIQLTGLLVGAERFAAKLALEMAADSAARGSVFAMSPSVGGLFLVTSMTMRTDMYIRSLTFGVSASKRQAIDVSIGLVHMPKPGIHHALFDQLSVAVSTLMSGIAYAT